MRLANAARDMLIKEEIFKQSRHIACYYAFKSEFATQPIMEAIWQAEKVCYLPVLTESKALKFVRYDQRDELQPNQYAIPEPVNMEVTVSPDKLDLVILPLVAFDSSGMRLGTGGGYYDRTFAFLQTRQEHKPFMLGLAYASQQAESISAEAWDIKMDAVLTEKALLTF